MNGNIVLSNEIASVTLFLHFWIENRFYVPNPTNKVGTFFNNVELLHLFQCLDTKCMKIIIQTNTELIPSYTQFSDFRL